MNYFYRGGIRRYNKTYQFYNAVLYGVSGAARLCDDGDGVVLSVYAVQQKVSTDGGGYVEGESGV